MTLLCQTLPSHVLIGLYMLIHLLLRFVVFFSSQTFPIIRSRRNSFRISFSPAVMYYKKYYALTTRVLYLDCMHASFRYCKSFYICMSHFLPRPVATTFYRRHCYCHLSFRILYFVVTPRILIRYKHSHPSGVSRGVFWLPGPPPRPWFFFN